MTPFTDAATGRVFDPHVVAARLHCLLCGRRRIAVVGVFVPVDGEMRAVVRRLRQHRIRANTSPAIAYGLCQRHFHEGGVAERVEDALIAAAARVRRQ